MAKINEDIIRLGNSAKALKENADFQMIMDSVRLQAFKAWASSDLLRPDVREAQYHMVKAIDAIKDNINALIDGGKMELHNAEQAAKKAAAEKQAAKDSDF